MQATPIMAVVPQNSGKAAQRVDEGGETADGVDFSALLMTHIKGARVAGTAELLDAGANLESEHVSLKLESVDLPLADDVAQQAVISQIGKDPVPDESLVPLAGIFVPVVAPVAVPVDTKLEVPVQSAVSGKMLDIVNRDSVVSGKFGKGVPETVTSDLNPVRQAEFAADGKYLPQGVAGKADENLAALMKNVEVQPRPVIAAETRSLPEMPASALPVMPMVNNSNVIETKPLLPATIQIPVGSTNWGEALGQKVIWMADQKTQVAELHLNPPNLGPMEVRISVNNDQISAIFVSHQPAVREAIEAAMPRLREMLADGGMTLGNASVSSDSLPQQQSSGRDGRSDSARQPDFPDIGGLHSSHRAGGVISLQHGGSGMVDLFA